MVFIDLFIKDMKNILYDVKSLAIILIMPIVLMSILGMSLQGVFGEEGDSGLAEVRVGIVKAYDYDQEMAKVEGRLDLSAYDQATIEGLDAEKNFFTLMDSEELSAFLSYDLMSEEGGRAALETGDITALIVLPRNFIFNSYMMLSGSRLVTEIDYYVNPDNDFFAGIIQGIIESYTDLNNQIYGQTRLLTMKLMAQGQMDVLDDIGDLLDVESMEASGVEVLVQGTVREETIDSFQYYAAAIMCMFLLYSAGIGGRALLYERREGTIARLVASGKGIGVIVASNFCRVMVLVMIQSSIMILYANLVLDVDWGNWSMVIVTILLSSFAVAALGVLVGVITLIADNYRIANLFEFAYIYIMALVGGSFIPVEGLPESLQRLGIISLNGQALKMYINGMYDLPVTASMNSITVLITFGLALIMASGLLVKRNGGALGC